MTFKTAFLSTAADHGFDEAEMDFSPFADFKIKWVRSSSWISFEVSDYLLEMPDRLARELGDATFRRIKGEDIQTPASVVDYIAENVNDLHRATFIRRARGFRLEGDYKPDHNSIAEMLECIRARGLTVPDDLILGWDVTRTADTEFRTSSVFKVVQIPVSIDDPEYCMEDVAHELYRSLCRIRAGYGADPDTVDAYMQEWY